AGVAESVRQTGRMGEAKVCSARGCQAEAGWALEWRNPKIHAPDRVKVWLACDEHRERLSDFLTRRSFPCHVRPVDDIG
ncbi:MAG: hypothetical protein ACRD0P_14440, partial [Stackebrandtia sp.]